MQAAISAMIYNLRCKGREDHEAAIGREGSVKQAEVQTAPLSQEAAVSVTAVDGVLVQALVIQAETAELGVRAGLESSARREHLEVLLQELALLDDLDLWEQWIYPT